jgi:hypothetical protein
VLRRLLFAYWPVRSQRNLRTRIAGACLLVVCNARSRRILRERSWRTVGSYARLSIRSKIYPYDLDQLAQMPEGASWYALSSVP